MASTENRNLRQESPKAPLTQFIDENSKLLSALGLFGMTLVIQLFVVPSGWPEHILWFSLLGLIIARGPGAISLDHLIWSGRAPMLAPVRPNAHA